MALNCYIIRIYSEILEQILCKNENSLKKHLGDTNISQCASKNIKQSGYSTTHKNTFLVQSYSHIHKVVLGTYDWHTCILLASAHKHTHTHFVGDCTHTAHSTLKQDFTSSSTYTHDIIFCEKFHRDTRFCEQLQHTQI